MSMRLVRFAASWLLSALIRQTIIKAPAVCTTLYETTPITSDRGQNHLEWQMKLTTHKPPLPDWWKVPKSDPIASISFQALCLISIGSLSPEQLWASRMNDDEWEKHRQKVIRRLSNTIIVYAIPGGLGDVLSSQDMKEI
ncbi:uncharacterized protein EDB91DRAFT_1263686 [Suillus paluster]|uniref:uncharacterized protein n=1 Tax=Suillus paluster TaxID=48578 RepID=UPI001B874EC2|nr:uncharacterized protein EDB91DRAFT_1263686 [Suillus paluster]KAG1726525.1 hypothetical protein EDB91DRAFT_1263686 [Suillus paluster]